MRGRYTWSGSVGMLEGCLLLKVRKVMPWPVDELLIRVFLSSQPLYSIGAGTVWTPLTFHPVSFSSSVTLIAAGGAVIYEPTLSPFWISIALVFSMVFVSCSFDQERCDYMGYYYAWINSVTHCFGVYSCGARWARLEQLPAGRSPQELACQSGASPHSSICCGEAGCSSLHTESLACPSQLGQCLCVCCCRVF